MGFFFENSGVTVKKASRKKDARPTEHLKKLRCSVCPLHTGDDADKAPEGLGSSEPLIYVIGEEPPLGLENKSPFSDKVGKIFFKLFPDTWFPENIRVGHITRCSSDEPKVEREDSVKAARRASKRAESITTATECCRGFLENDIIEKKPLVVIGLGERALKWATGQSNVEMWRGKRIPLKLGDHSFWFYPLLSPRFIKENKRVSKKGEEYDSIWDAVYRSDVEKIVEGLSNDSLGDPLVEKESEYFEGIKIYYGKKNTDLENIEKDLLELAKAKEIAVDVETTGFRPYGEGQRLLCLAIGTKKKTIAIAYDHPNQKWSSIQKAKIKKLLQNFFDNKSQVKIAHNLGMEQEWLSFHLGPQVLDQSNWGDTLYQAYLLDNNKGCKSLDAQCLINFGMHLKSISNIDTSRCIEYDIEDLLKYNALDTKYTHKLFQKLRKELKAQGYREEPYTRGIETITSLTKIQRLGLVVDLNVVGRFSKSLERDIEKLQKRIRDLPEVDKFTSMFGAFNPGSNNHIQKILRGVHKLTKVTSVNESSLKDLDPEKYPIIPMVLEYRNLNKQKSTYVDSYYELIYPDGRLHTKYSNVFADTGRLSSSEPNLQNIPKRKNKGLREMFVPPAGHYIVAADYGQIEARIIGMLSKDEKFCEALWNNYDVHMDWAVWLAKRYPKIVGGKEFVEDAKKLKLLRQEIKNKFVFPSFFGSTPFSIAANLGIEGELAEKMQEAFWKEFAGAKSWQNSLLKLYEKKGFIETPTGRRFQAPLTKNKIFNFPIQGTAADLMLEGMNRLSKEGYDIAVQIHDDLTFYIAEDVVDESIQHIAEIMTGVDMPFINVPLTVEVEKSNTNWAEMVEVGVFSSEDFKKS